MSDPKTIERMRKILALARRGVGGEKETAEAMLNRLLQKYGMTVSDLDSSLQPKQRYQFAYANKLEKRLLTQVIAKVLDTRDLSLWVKRGARYIMVDLTKAEYAEIDLAYGLYRKSLAKEVERLFSAFIQANSIFPESPPDDDYSGPQMSLEELEALLDMMRGIRPTPIYKMIEA